MTFDMRRHPANADSNDRTWGTSDDMLRGGRGQGAGGCWFRPWYFDGVILIDGRLVRGGIYRVR